MTEIFRKGQERGGGGRERGGRDRERQKQRETETKERQKERERERLTDRELQRQGDRDRGTFRPDVKPCRLINLDVSFIVVSQRRTCLPCILQPVSNRLDGAVNKWMPACFSINHTIRSVAADI